MKHLIIPDIHHRIDVADWIFNRVEFDRAILLGDYFDDFGDTPEIAVKTAVWLREHIDNKDFTFLVGNHDLPYMYPHNRGLYCSGFEKLKSAAILQELNIFDFREKTKLFHRVDNVVFSHAGISRTLLEYLVYKGYLGSVASTASELELQLTSLLPSLRNWNESGAMVHPLVDAGCDRGGKAEVGGATWCDLSYFQPTPNIVQVFGHTPIFPTAVAIQLQSKNKDGSFNRAHPSYPEKESRDLKHLYQNGIGIDIDSHLCSFATWDSTTGEFNVHKIKFVYNTYKHPIVPTSIESTTIVWSFNTKTQS